MELTENQLDILGHTLGINVYHCKLSKRKKDKYLPESFYRNYFCAGTEKHHDINTLLELEKLTLMDRFSKFENLIFCVTDKGKQVFTKVFIESITIKYKPLTKSKQNYDDFIYSEYPGTFSEYLGIIEPRINYRSAFSNLRQFISIKYDGVKGEFKTTNKEAKKSYKLALKKYLNN